MNKNDSYSLNFVIPRGPIGPKGLTGNTGPMGPTGSIGTNNILDSMAYIEYNDSSSNNTPLPISSVTILPRNSNIYVRENDLICTEKSGYYEFTISGILERSSLSEDVSLVLKTNVRNDESRYSHLITVKMNSNEYKKYFYSTRLGRYGTLQQVRLLLIKPDSSNASIKNIKLIIKRLAS